MSPVVVMITIPVVVAFQDNRQKAKQKNVETFEFRRFCFLCIATIKVNQKLPESAVKTPMVMGAKPHGFGG